MALSTRTTEDFIGASRRIRQTLRSGGRLPEGVLRAEIDASWRRSLDFGVSCDEPALASDAAPDAEQVLAVNRLLLDAATPQLDYLTRQLGDSGLIILGDSEARVLAIEGQTAQLARFGLHDLRVGSCWSEALRGTNALGTALVEARPTLIDCGEHYLDRLSQFSCTSVPIRDPQGGVVGVLDLTRVGLMAQPQDNLATLMLAASQIESRLFASLHPEQLVVAFHCRRQYLDSPWQGLLALDLDGTLLAANDQACALLELPRELLLGRRCTELLGGDSQNLLRRLQQGAPLSVQTARGEFCCRTLQLPAAAGAAASAGLWTGVRPTPARADCLEALAGDDPRLARALRMARQGLAGGLPVLLLGETGTGKEVVAQALHQASARADKPFVAVNCAAIPEGLIESELFGYREGAFTGSRRGGMVGRLQQAHGGTLFLDEIGDMPLALQARLLRVLQERKVLPLGGGAEQDIDVAIVCATHRDLRTQVQDKGFREDLYYRINGISLRLPALREREDLAALIERLLAKLGAPQVRLDADLTELFEQYDWPGNIRQLEMVLRAALAMREDDESLLGLDHLSDSLLDELTASTRQASSIRENELKLIRDTLDRHQGNVSAAAEALGISRATLYRKLKQLRGGPAC